jgi:sulfonate dioxygenase
LPVYDNETTFPPIKPFDFADRGLLADKAKKNLLHDPKAKVTELTPRVGTEIRGLQLSKLTDAQKNELALLIAERGVVIFRDQDFKDIGPQKQKELGAYFGPLHVHVHFPFTQSLNPKADLLIAGWCSCQGAH